MTLRQALERSEGHLAKLEPSFGERAAKWFKECWAKKVFVLIYCSTRTPEEQEELWKKGRVPGHPGPKVTNAKGYLACQSMHCYGKAIDFAPLSQGGTGSWSVNWGDEETYEIAHRIAESYKLRRLDWETPHLEDATLTGWRELVVPQKEEAVKKQKKVVSKKKPWASR